MRWWLRPERARLERGSSRRLTVMRRRPAYIRVINRRRRLFARGLPRRSVAQLGGDHETENHGQGLTGPCHIRSVSWKNPSSGEGPGSPKIAARFLGWSSGSGPDHPRLKGTGRRPGGSWTRSAPPCGAGFPKSPTCSRRPPRKSSRTCTSPRSLERQIHSTNPLERLNRELAGRFDVGGDLPEPAGGPAVAGRGPGRGPRGLDGLAPLLQLRKLQGETEPAPIPAASEEL